MEIKIPENKLKQYKVRRPFDDIDGYMESDSDYLENNNDLAVWLLDQMQYLKGD